MASRRCPERMQFEPFDLLGAVEEGQARARYNLSTSDMPPTRLSEVTRLGDLLLSENTPGGGDALRSLLARRFGGRKEEYIVTCGASEANFAVVAGLIRAGDAVLVESPVYQPLRSIPQGLGAKATALPRWPEDGYAVTADHVSRAKPANLRLLVLTNLHNPSGAAIPGRDLRALSDLAAEEGFYILVDEIFRELAFKDPPPTMGGMSDRVVTTSGVSKFYGAGGLRIGWIRASRDAREKIRRVLDYMSIAPSGISERIALALLRKKPQVAARNRRLMREGRKIAIEWAESTPGVEWVDTPGNLRFPLVPANTAALSSRLLSKYRTFIAPGEAFDRPGHFRLNVGLGPNQVAEGLRRVGRALHDV